MTETLIKSNWHHQKDEPIYHAHSHEVIGEYLCGIDLSIKTTYGHTDYEKVTCPDCRNILDGKPVKKPNIIILWTVRVIGSPIILLMALIFILIITISGFLDSFILLKALVIRSKTATKEELKEMFKKSLKYGRRK